MEKVAEALNACGIRYEMGPLATALEAESLDQILEAVRAVHGSLQDQLPRIEMDLTIDHRLDKQESLESLEKGVPEDLISKGPGR